MDYLVLKTAFELLSYVRACMDDKNVTHSEFNRFILLYNLLIDFVSTSLSKEKGEVNCVKRTKE